MDASQCRTEKKVLWKNLMAEPRMRQQTARAARDQGDRKGRGHPTHG